MASRRLMSVVWTAIRVIVFLFVVTCVSIVIISLWKQAIYYPESLGLPISDQTLDARGNAVGALFSGLAFVGVVAAIILQTVELKYQRQEMHETNEAMRESATAQKNQTVELRDQTNELRAQLKIMEQTSAYEQFFQLVRFLNEQRDDRKAIYDLMAKPLIFEKWHPDTKKMGEKVCTGFNLAGILARRGGLLGQLIIDSYRRSAVTLRGGLDPLLIELRADRGQQYCQEFDWLVNQMNSPQHELL
jgi:hypothetical protein